VFDSHSNRFDDEALRAINARQAQLLLGSGVVILMLVLALTAIALRPRIPAYVVALDGKTGAVLGVAHPVAGPNTLPASVTRYMLQHFIQDAKGVSDNLDLERTRLDSVYAFARGQAYKAIDDFYHSDDSHNPMKQALAGRWVEVNITRCLAQPQPDTYLIEWSESAHTAHGQQVLMTNWQALVKVATTAPDPTNVLNPLGEYVINLDWS
jgi:type IV secretory pathway TrbF-like protein